MKKILLFVLVSMFSAAGVYMLANKKEVNEKKERDIISLPKPDYTSKTSVEEALLKRRSVRKYKDEPLTLKELSQLLWSAQGITNERGFRTAPSAGALYPLKLYVIVQNVGGIDRTVYKYLPNGHKIIKMKNIGRMDYSKISRQSWIFKGGVVFIITADYRYIGEIYGKWARRFTDMEAGHAAQNIQLQGVSLGIGSCVVGAFNGGEIDRILNLPENETSIYLIPAGKK
jgi:SagB-type dehydrogenase family enzyme